MPTVLARCSAEPCLLDEIVSALVSSPSLFLLKQEEAGSKAVITLAARLLDLEQSIPDAAIATGVGAEAWAEWE